MLGGGLEGGEWKLPMVQAKLKTEKEGMDTTGKTAPTAIGFASREFTTLFTYG